MPRLDWIVTEDLNVTDEHVFIRTAVGEAIVIPRRLVHDPADVDRIVAWRQAAMAAAETAPSDVS